MMNEQFISLDYYMSAYAQRNERKGKTYSEAITRAVHRRTIPRVTSTLSALLQTLIVEPHARRLGFIGSIVELDLAGALVVRSNQ